MLDVAIVLLFVGPSIAALLFLFKRAAQQDARDRPLRDEQPRETESRSASSDAFAGAPAMTLDDLRLSNIRTDIRKQFDELRSRLK